MAIAGKDLTAQLFKAIGKPFHLFKFHILFIHDNKFISLFIFDEMQCFHVFQFTNFQFLIYKL